MVEISIILPTYNRPHFLNRALHSIKQQSFKNFEVIVVNDGQVSVDNIISNYNFPVKLVTTGGNKGLSFARNEGLENSSAEYIAYLDDDDLYKPDHLSTLFHHLKNSDFLIAYAGCQVKKYYLKNEEPVYIKKGHLFNYPFNKNQLFVENYIPVISFLHHKSCFKDSRPFNELLKTHEDWDVWMGIALNHEFLHINKITSEVTFIENSNSITNSKSFEFLHSRALLYKKYEQFVSEEVKKEQQKKFIEFYSDAAPIMQKYILEEGETFANEFTLQAMIDNTISFFNLIENNVHRNLIINLIARTIGSEKRVKKLEKNLIRINLPDKYKL